MATGLWCLWGWEGLAQDTAELRTTTVSTRPFLCCQLPLRSSQACRLLAAVALQSGCERKPPPSAQAPSSSQPKFSLLDDSTLLLPLMDALTHFLTLASVVDFRGH